MDLTLDTKNYKIPHVEVYRMCNYWVSFLKKIFCDLRLIVNYHLIPNSVFLKSRARKQAIVFFFGLKQQLQRNSTLVYHGTFLSNSSLRMADHRQNYEDYVQ